MVKYYVNPFATAGDQTAIPDDTQLSGNVSFEDGWTIDYALEQGVDIDAKDIDRAKHNYLFNTLTENVKLWQDDGFPPWTAAADAGGIDVEYPIYAIVRYTDGSLYRSVIADNSGEPTIDTSDWIVWDGVEDAASETVAGVIEIATNSEAVAKTATDKALVPSNLPSLAASTTFAGLTEYATIAETQALASAGLAVTPAGLGGLSASETTVGLIEIATNAEVAALSATDKAVVPSALGALVISTSQAALAILATTAEVQAGTEASKVVTPNTLAARTATDARTGLAELATDGETQAGTDAVRIVTPAGLASTIGVTIQAYNANNVAVSVAEGSIIRGNSGGSAWEALAVGTNGQVLTLDSGLPVWDDAIAVPPASTTVAGIIELATDTEAVNKSATDRALTPSNLAALGASAAFAGLVEFATDGETQTGTDTTRGVTPAGLSSRTATETRTGVIELATAAEVVTGTDTTRAVTVAGLYGATPSTTQRAINRLATTAEAQGGSEATAAMTPATLAAVTALTTRAGVVELATDAETETGTDATRAVTPAGLASVIGVTIQPYSPNSLELTPSTGGVIAGNVAGDAWEVLEAGTNGQILTLAGGIPTWAANSGGSGTQASTTIVGITRYATDVEAIAKTETEAAITASNLAALSASASFEGMVELSTNNETRTGIVTDRAVTPASLTSRFATNVRTGLARIGTDAEVIAGTVTDNDDPIFVTAEALYVPTPSTTQRAVNRLATIAEAQAGSEAIAALTPNTLAAVTALTTRAGVAELATSAETQTGTDATRTVTPAGLASTIGAQIQAYSANTVVETPVVGSIITGQTGPAWGTLAAGTEGQVLTMGASEPAWQAATGGSSTFRSAEYDLAGESVVYINFDDFSSGLTTENEIVVAVDTLEVSTLANIVVQIGNGTDTPETTGYNGTTWNSDSTPTANSNGWMIAGVTSSARIIGVFRLTSTNANKWFGEGSLGSLINPEDYYVNSARLNFSSPVNVVAIRTLAGTFDAGTVSITVRT